MNREADAALRRRAELWIEGDPDPATQEELRALLAQPDLAATDLADRFAGPLEFGTAGLRGVIGAGPHRMNRAVVARATWGLLQVVRGEVRDAARRGVVVGADARLFSREFAEDVGAIFGAAGFHVTLFRDPVPTPLVAFAVKHLGAAAGVVITASHNPREYNGYKVYWDNGAQIAPPIDEHIARAIEQAPRARDVARPALSALETAGLLTAASEEIASAYVAAIRAFSSEALRVSARRPDRSLSLVYTPLHGVGDALMRRALREAGFTRVASVPEQRAPDGTFPTVAFPNPEEAGTMDRALAFAAASGADLVLANDPDADRLAVAVRQRSPARGYRQLTGNEVGILLGHALLTDTENATNAEKKRPAVLTSIVSSPGLGTIAKGLGVHYEETLTGFKWIANRAIELEEAGYAVVFGYEEALGYCAGSAVRDKDGISAGLLVAELAARFHGEGLTLLDALDAIARRWGLFMSKQVSVARKGAGAAQAMTGMMDALRARPPARIAGDAVVTVVDYRSRSHPGLLPTPAPERPGPSSGRPSPLFERPSNLPSSDVLAFHLASGARIVARPSGTEPKAKFYFDIRVAVGPGESIDLAEQRGHARLAELATHFVDGTAT